MNSVDTIVAIATPPGKGGIGIVRISGPDSELIATRIIGQETKPRIATYCKFLAQDHPTIDEGIVLFFRAPASFTGEDVVEFQGHGGPVVLDLLLKQVLSYGARMARPGEFSERAFLNDKIDLTQAEAIADLIEAGSEHAARAAQKSLQGAFSSVIHNLVDQLTQLRMYVEAAIDFPEEEIDFLADEKLIDDLNKVMVSIKEVERVTEQGILLREGMTVVLTGQPNVGKSSLLNKLSGQDAAIVTDVPGTTRDILSREINLKGLPLHIVDTAGLRNSDDVVEKEGIRRARSEIEKADRILLVVDTSKGIDAEDHVLLESFPKHIPVTVVHNKIDLTANKPQIIQVSELTSVYLSASQDIGINLLQDHLQQSMGFSGITEGSFVARRRHLEALQRARHYIEAGHNNLQVHRAGELLAEDLRQAQMALSEITGEFTPDDLLGKIFSSFCIGK